jgi:hypothetical protein
MADMGLATTPDAMMANVRTPNALDSSGASDLVLATLGSVGGTTTPGVLVMLEEGRKETQQAGQAMKQAVMTTMEAVASEGVAAETAAPAALVVSIARLLRLGVPAEGMIAIASTDRSIVVGVGSAHQMASLT